MRTPPPRPAGAFTVVWRCQECQDLAHSTYPGPEPWPWSWPPPGLPGNEYLIECECDGWRRTAHHLVEVVAHAPREGHA